jgi:ABC-type Fe3+ transport system permease subunit
MILIIGIILMALAIRYWFGKRNFYLHGFSSHEKLMIARIGENVTLFIVCFLFIIGLVFIVGDFIYMQTFLKIIKDITND